MDYDAQLKLQSYMDGELPEPEAKEIAIWLANDREAVALLGELRNTRQAFVGLEVGVTLPESREFFWSRIEREIRVEPEPAPAPQAWWVSAWRWFLLPAGAVAALALAAIIGLFGSSKGPAPEMAIADPSAFTYHDFPSRTTLVWLTYPAEEFADNGASEALQ